MATICWPLKIRPLPSTTRASVIETGPMYGASSCRSFPVVDSNLTLTHTNNQKRLAT
jgi:hypothetical protein